jgi:hypothetical protein
MQWSRLLPVAIDDSLAIFVFTLLTISRRILAWMIFDGSWTVFETVHIFVPLASNASPMSPKARQGKALKNQDALSMIEFRVRHSCMHGKQASMTGSWRPGVRTLNRSGCPTAIS